MKQIFSLLLSIIFIFSANAWDDYLYWQQTDGKMVKRINALIKDISRSPFDGIGKPEPLKHALAGYWSRRINREHRLIYEVVKDTILIHSAKGHYD